jgi:3-methyl-2-oxobutanoate hydroxymethyltransferase
MTTQKVTAAAIAGLKGKGAVTMVTAYDYPTATVLDEAGVDIVLIGDSLGNTVLGLPNTLPVTMADTLRHTAAVARGTRRALVVADLPFLSYGVSVEETVRNAGACLKEAGAEAVKLEGGSSVAEQVARLVALGIPVMGHLGLTPQSIHRFGGMKVQGRGAAEAERLLSEARILQEAGVFSIVLEAIPAAVATRITESLAIPTIGIGAGPGCDGQVLVFHDLVGWSPAGFAPRFVKRYADVRQVMVDAVSRYVAEVRAGEFPDEAHSYGEKP